MSSTPDTRTSSADGAAWIIERAKRVLLHLTRSDGALICPVHRLEHLGKSAYLLRVPGLLEAAAEAALVERLTTSLRAHPREPHAWVFGQGPTRAKNLANWVVDSASVVAGLAAWMQRGGSEARTRAAVQQCAHSYLVQAATTKSVLAQRAWALWGLAEAARALDSDALRQASVLALHSVLDAIQTDGSVLYDLAAAAPGTASGSVFYHSRVMGFACFAARAIERYDLIPDALLQRSAHWLATVLFPDGGKAARPEAKPWYFPSGGEDVSAPFDLLLLVPAALAHRDTQLAALAAARLQRYRSCFEREHEVSTGRSDGAAFQCDFFFAAHAMLLLEITAAQWDEIDPLAALAREQGADASAGWEILGGPGAEAATALARWRGVSSHALWCLERGASSALHGSEASGMLAGQWNIDAGTHWVPPQRENPSGFRWRGKSSSPTVTLPQPRSELRFALHLLRMPRGRRGSRPLRRSRWQAFLSTWRAERFAASGWHTTADAKLVAVVTQGRRLTVRWRDAAATEERESAWQLERTIVATQRGYVCRDVLILDRGTAIRELRFVAPPTAFRVRAASVPSQVLGPTRILVRYTLPT